MRRARNESRSARGIVLCLLCVRTDGHQQADAEIAIGDRGIGPNPASHTRLNCLLGNHDLCNLSQSKPAASYITILELKSISSLSYLPRGEHGKTRELAIHQTIPHKTSKVTKYPEVDRLSESPCCHDTAHSHADLLIHKETGRISQQDN
jgi:hypothetical protein